MLGWLDEIAEEFDDRVRLDLRAQRVELSLWQVGRDAEVTAIFAAAREAVNFHRHGLGRFGSPQRLGARPAVPARVRGAGAPTPGPWRTAPRSVP